MSKVNEASPVYIVDFLKKRRASLLFGETIYIPKSVILCLKDYGVDLTEWEKNPKTPYEIDLTKFGELSCTDVSDYPCSGWAFNVTRSGIINEVGDKFDSNWPCIVASSDEQFKRKDWQVMHALRCEANNRNEPIVLYKAKIPRCARYAKEKVPHSLWLDVLTKKAKIIGIEVIKPEN